jgi:hypothetical protein
MTKKARQEAALAGAAGYPPCSLPPCEDSSKRIPMHAALMHLTIDPALAPAAAAAFTNELLPRVRTSLGFVAGYWMEPVEGQGFGFVLFETEEQARKAMPRSPLGQRPEWLSYGWTFDGWPSRYREVSISRYDA